MAENVGNEKRKSYSYWSMVWRRFRRHKPAVISLVLLVTIFLFSFLGGIIWRIAPDETIPYRDVFSDVIRRTERIPYFDKLNKQVISYAEVNADEKLSTLLYTIPEIQPLLEKGVFIMGDAFYWFKKFTADAEHMAMQAQKYAESGRDIEDAFSPYLSVISVIGNEINVYNQLNQSIYNASYKGKTLEEIVKEDPNNMDAGTKQFIVNAMNNFLTIINSSLTFYDKDVKLPKEYDQLLRELRESDVVKKAKDHVLAIEDTIQDYKEYLDKENLYLQSYQNAYEFLKKAIDYKLEAQKAALIENYKVQKGFYSETGCGYENPCNFCQSVENTLCEIPQGADCEDLVTPKLCDETLLAFGTDTEPAVCDLCGYMSSKLMGQTDFSQFDALENPCVAKIYMDSVWKSKSISALTDVEKKIEAYETFPNYAGIVPPKNLPSLTDYDYVKNIYYEKIARIEKELSYYKKLKGSLKAAADYASSEGDAALSKRKFAEKLVELSGIDKEEDPVVKQNIYGFIKDMTIQACDVKKDCKDVIGVLSQYIDNTILRLEKSITYIKADLKEYKTTIKDINYYKGVVEDLASKKPFEKLLYAVRDIFGENNLAEIMKNHAMPVYRDMFDKVDADVKQNKDQFQYDRLIIANFRDFVNYWSQQEFPLDKTYYAEFILRIANTLIPNFNQYLDEYLVSNVPGYLTLPYEEREIMKSIYGVEYVKQIVNDDKLAGEMLFGKGAIDECKAGNITALSVKQMDAIVRSPLFDRLKSIRQELYGEEPQTSGDCPVASDLEFIYYSYNQFASFRSTVASYGIELEFKAHSYGKLYYGYGKAWYTVAGIKGEDERTKLENLVEFPHLPVFSKGHPLGTDDKGRDVLARLIFGGQVSLLVGILSVIISITVGTVIGITSGFYGGWWDNLSMRFVDIMMNIPSLPLLLALSQALRKFSNFFSETLHMGAIGGAMPIAIVLAIWSWMGLARLVRGQVLSVKEQQYVEAARAIGTPNARIMFKHILPNVSAAIIVAATLRVGGAMLAEASLSFLGFGVQPPATSWGQMLQNATQIFQIPGYMYLVILPGTLLFLTVLAFNFLGDGLRDALDPRMKL